MRSSRIDLIYSDDARDMSKVESNSVALVVTSPPYFAGKEYEESLGQNGVPATYFEYLALLKDVFEECKRVLEPGGRIAVNVANLGRRPYRSLAGDVTEILQDLGLLLRGEVVWWKGRAAGGSCAWGTFQRPSNPVLRDVTERIVIASKGRFDRAIKPAHRLKLGYPSTATISRDEFLEATTDLWEIPPESATRVGHPAPFPVALPTRLIELFTYEDDVVLDPFMGSGSTAVAAVRSNRHYIGFDTDKSYIGRANERIAEEVERLQRHGPFAANSFRVELPAVSFPAKDEDIAARAVREGRQAKDVAESCLKAADSSTFARTSRSRAWESNSASSLGPGRWRAGPSTLGYISSTSSRGLRRTRRTLESDRQGRARSTSEESDLPLVLLTTACR